LLVIPAQAGIHAIDPKRRNFLPDSFLAWIPACAGMTSFVRARVKNALSAARISESAPSEGMHDLDTVARSKFVLAMPAARHDFPVHLDRDPALGQMLGLQERGDGGAVVGEGEGVAIEQDVHARIVAACGDARTRRASAMPQRSVYPCCGA